MTLVVGTCGHIDHGKTTLLHALTGIDADRLPEERARGMTIDVGYAHMTCDDGSEIDFVDVPGHDRLVGNMLVGAGEIDAWLLVVAADDGPRAQTLEHLELLAALGLRHGLAVVSKTDIAEPERVAEVRGRVAALLAAVGAPDAQVISFSAQTGAGLVELRGALLALRASLAAAAPGRWRLAVDRVFSVRGRGAVVTGTLRGEPIGTGADVRVLPEGGRTRVREVQVHGRRVERSPAGGRVALNLAGVEATDLRRGQVLLAGGEREAVGADEPAAPEGTDTLLVALRPPVRLAAAAGAGRTGPRERRSAYPPRQGERVRLHLGTDQVDATVHRLAVGAAPDDRLICRLRLDRPTAAAPGDRFVLRLPDPARLLCGGLVVEPRPVHGPARRRLSGPILRRMADAVSDPAHADAPGWREARLTLHGLRVEAAGVTLAADIETELRAEAVERVDEHHAAHPDAAGMPLSALRVGLARSLRRRVTATPDVAARAVDALIARLVVEGSIVRAGDLVRRSSWQPAARPAQAFESAEKLVGLLDTPTPPPLSEACRASGCPPALLRELEASGRIVRLAEDLAWSSTAFEALAAQAVRLATAEPLTPARFRDATGTSRKYVMAILEELDRRAVLRRTPAGHLPGPRAGAASGVGH